MRRQHTALEGIHSPERIYIYRGLLEGLCEYAEFAKLPERLNGGPGAEPGAYVSRELADWLTSYLEFTKNSEPPQSYHTWCGLSVIAGALQRKVRLEWGFEKIYANLYIILAGPSGRTRKGVALGIAKSILSSISGISIAPESSSGRESTVLAMKRAMANYEDPYDGKIKIHCSLTAFSEELSVFLGQGDVKYLANLTDWYDSTDSWTYETIGRGTDSLQGICFNLAGGTAPDWIQSMLPQEAIGGGFTARIIFIVEEAKGQTVPKHDMTQEELDLREKLIRDLERISYLKGRYFFTPDGEAAYIDWYEKQDALLTKGQAAVEDNRFASYCERRATHLRKVMMLMSASRGDSLEISLDDFTRAEATLRGAERKMHRTFGGLGQAKYSEATERVLDYIKMMGTTTRKVLMAKFYRDVDGPTLHTIEETLVQMGAIKVTLLPKDGDKVYYWLKKD